MYLRSALVALKDIEWLSPKEEALAFLKGTHVSSSEGFVDVFNQEKVATLDEGRLQNVRTELLFELMQFCFK